METLEQIRDRLSARFLGAKVELVPNPGPAAEHSLLLDATSARAIALFLRDDPSLKLDYCSNVTGVDWPEKEIIDTKKVSVPDPAGGPAKIVEEKTKRLQPGYLEAVYHLYSIALKHGPVIIRLRTGNRSDQVTLPSLTPVWRSADFQEREIYDLYGIIFEGHPDLRRLLMWDGFKDHPMRRDYVAPDDFEWEPTPHGAVLDRAKGHYPSPVAQPLDEPRRSPTGEGGPPQNPPGGQTMSLFSNMGAAAGPVVRAVHDEFHGDLLEVSMGPQHPSTHGVFRMVVTLDGERIVKLKPVFGYLHRNHEKIAEGTSYLASMPYTDRLDYLCSMSNNWAYALAVEKLSGQAVPDRAQYLRIIMAELTRLVNHMCLVGFLFNDLGTSFTPLLYAFREREKILDLFESLSGSRMMCNYQRFGGCRVDPSPEWLATASALVNNFPRFLDEYETMLTGNEIMLARTQGVGRMNAQHAINAGITGPGLRASGVDYDIRKVDGYGFYPRFNFRVPLGAHGDTYDRYMMRILEMRESVKILQQAFRDLPAGPIMDPKAKLRGFRPKPGEAYGRLEGPKGELGFYLISDGSPNPWRYRVRPPSLINLTLLEEMCLGHTIADSVVILGSIDIVLGEVDR